MILRVFPITSCGIGALWREKPSWPRKKIKRDWKAAQDSVSG